MVIRCKTKTRGDKLVPLLEKGIKVIISIFFPTYHSFNLLTLIGLNLKKVGHGKDMNNDIKDIKCFSIALL